MSNPVLEAIAARRSIRAYTDAQVTRAQLDAILQAGLEAPSARNSQPWHFTAVQDAALINRVNDAFKAQMDDERFTAEGYSVFHHAPTVIFISSPAPEGGTHFAPADVGIAIENMALAAHSLGLGSVILGFPRMAFEGPQADALRKALAFPEGYDYCLSISIGTPAATKEAHPIEPGKVTIIG